MSNLNQQQQELKIINLKINEENSRHNELTKLSESWTLLKLRQRQNLDLKHNIVTKQAQYFEYEQHHQNADKQMQAYYQKLTDNNFDDPKII